MARGSGDAGAPTDDYVRAALATVIAKLNRLQALAAAHHDGHLFRYEDLHAEPAAELARLLRILGHDDMPQSHIEAAVAFAAFDQLKQREDAGFYRSDNLHPAKAGEPDSFKVRRGRVGGYRDELSADQVAMMNRMIDTTLAPGLGYRTDEPVPRSRGGVAIADHLVAVEVRAHDTVDGWGPMLGSTLPER